ncbi:MAG TPA: TlpA disulfide reductase family protein [Candidatus Polarisedimenticolia bacterium]|jgi:peroxiredoxin
MAESPGGVIGAGGRIPAFTLPLQGGGEATVPVRGSKGLTLAVFYKNTCPTCRLSFPFLQRLYEQVGPAGGRVLGISQDGMEGAASFAREFGLTMPILVDGEDWPVSRLYDLVSVPTLYLTDGDGLVLASGAGFNRRELQTMADALAASVGAAAPLLYREGESIPDFKPG